MSLFGGKPSTSTSFSFGSTTNTSSPAKPLFGATASTGSLFGSTTTTTSAPLFGSTTTTTSAAGSLFGSKPAVTSSSTGLFGSTATTTSGSLFGAKPATTSTAGLFGSTTGSTSGGLFGSKTTSGSLFGAKPTAGGLFGGPANGPSAQPATRQRETLNTILLNADAVVRSLTSPELYGDDRDQIIAKLNQVAAALGVGNGYYKDGQCVPYNNEGPFHRFKAVGYNAAPEFTEADGIVSLIIKASASEFASSAQKQKLIDILFGIIGGDPNFPVKIKSIKELPDNITEANIFVVNKASGTPALCSQLAALLSEPAKKQQLEAQLKVDKVIARFAMDKYQKERFTKDPPAGFDDALWLQACKENPDPSKLLPFPIRGFEQLLQRQKTQLAETAIANKVIDNLSSRLSSLDASSEAASVQASQQKVTQKQLAHRLLRILCMQMLQQRFGHPIDATEEKIKAALESLNARLNGPQQVKERLVELTGAMRDTGSEIREKLVSAPAHTLSENDIQQLQKYLSRCQDGLESLSAIVRDDCNQLKRIGAVLE